MSPKDSVNLRNKNYELYLPSTLQMKRVDVQD
jgi:hypothetical protein